jgi:hypothetical protein
MAYRLKGHSNKPVAMLSGVIQPDEMAEQGDE